MAATAAPTHNAVSIRSRRAEAVRVSVQGVSQVHPERSRRRVRGDRAKPRPAASLGGLSGRVLQQTLLCELGRPVSRAQPADLTALGQGVAGVLARELQEASLELEPVVPALEVERDDLAAEVEVEELDGKGRAGAQREVEVGDEEAVLLADVR